MNLRLLDLLSELARDLTVRVDADACSISRVIGDVLILVAERTADGRTLQQGQGYLVSDFPQTAEVLRTLEPRALTLADADIDPSEAAVLQGFGFAALLMLPLSIRGEVWGLVELYREAPRAFGAAEQSAARAAVDAAAARTS